jgi:hypothetical protein
MSELESYGDDDWVQKRQRACMMRPVVTTKPTT